MTPAEREAKMGVRAERAPEQQVTAVTSPIERWHAWTDGSADNVHKSASYGIVLVSPEGEQMTFSRPISKEATSAYAELLAIGLAVKLVPEGQALRVNTDSQYAIGVLAKWKPDAKWRNLDLILDIRRELSKRNVEFRWVKGHSGNAMNELADRLATEARRV